MTRRRGSKRRGSRRRGGGTAPFAIKTDSVENYNKSVYSQADAMIKLWGKMRAAEMQQSTHSQRVVYKNIADNIAVLLKHGLMATLDEKEFDVVDPQQDKNRKTLVSIATELNKQVLDVPEVPFFDGDVNLKLGFTVPTTNELGTIDFITEFFNIYLDESKREFAMNKSEWYDKESPSPYNVANAKIWAEIGQDLLTLRKLIIGWIKVLSERRELADKLIAELAKKESAEKIQAYKEAADVYFKTIIENGDHTHETSKTRRTELFFGEKRQIKLNHDQEHPGVFRNDTEKQLHDIMHASGNYQNDSVTSSYYHDGRTRSSTTYNNKYSVYIAQTMIQERINQNRAKVVLKSLKPYVSAPFTAWMSQLYSSIKWIS